MWKWKETSKKSLNIGIGKRPNDGSHMVRAVTDSAPGNTRTEQSGGGREPAMPPSPDLTSSAELCIFNYSQHRFIERMLGILDFFGLCFIEFR